MQARVDMKLIRIITNFLKSRQAYVRMGSHKGDAFNLTAGVPQGDILNPTLSLIVGNDYPEPTRDNGRSNIALQYADDFTQAIISKFNSRINQAARERHKKNIEDEINKQNEYERKWKIKTNVSKFNIINIGFYKALTVGGIHYRFLGKFCS